MIAATEDEIDEHVSPSVLNGIKQKLMVIDLINKLDIADGLKGVLISRGFTLKWLLNASGSDFATLGVDPYVGKFVMFKSIRAISMHLKMTGTRHVINFINYGNYDKKTGLREMTRPELQPVR
jgi:hypothetical protein